MESSKPSDDQTLAAEPSFDDTVHAPGPGLSDAQLSDSETLAVDGAGPTASCGPDDTLDTAFRALGRSRAPASTATVGGRYDLDELLGRGGMGEVWRAADLRLERDVALKRIPT